MSVAVRPLVLVSLGCWLLYMLLIGWGPGGVVDQVARGLFAVFAVVGTIAAQGRKPTAPIDRARLETKDVRRLELVNAGSILMILLLLTTLGLDVLGDPVMERSEFGRLLIRIGTGTLVAYLALASPLRRAYASIAGRQRP